LVPGFGFENKEWTRGNEKENFSANQKNKKFNTEKMSPYLESGANPTTSEFAATTPAQ
jgi:hypothetical protein